MEIDWENYLLRQIQQYKGTVDSGRIGRYYLTLFFVKYISDQWFTSLKQYRKLYGGDKDMIDRKMSRERFVLEETSTFDFLFLRRNAPDLGDLINKVLGQIETANKEKLEGVFTNVDFNSEYDLGDTPKRNLVLKELIEFLGDIYLEADEEEQRSAIVEGFLSAIIGFDGLRNGQFYTPRAICELMTDLLVPQAGHRIYDPACGTGGFLISAAEKVKDSSGNPSRDYALYGQEINKEALAMSKMNLILHGLDSVYLAQGDVLSEPKWLEDGDLMKFDIVLSNIPFGGRVEYTFIQHMLASAKKKGRVGVLVPLGVLFREGKELSIRKEILEKNLLEAVISLPSNLFNSSSVACAIMLFDMNRSKQDKVLFINASKDFEAGKRQNKLLNEHIERIISSYTAFKKGKTDVKANLNFSRCVTRKEIANCNYNLTVSRYVDVMGEEETNVNTVLLEKEIAELEKELTAIKKALEKELKELKDLKQ